MVSWIRDSEIMTVSTLCLTLISVSLASITRSDSARTCGSEFDDIASSSLTSPVVFEGKILRVHSETDDGDIQSERPPSSSVVLVQPLTVFKGRTTELDRSSVVIGYFSQSNPDLDQCVAPLSDVHRNRKYIIFARLSELRNSTDNLFRLTAMPVRRTKRTVATVVEYTDCSRCGRSPTVLLMPNVMELSIQQGQRLELRCRVRRGRPTPRIVWFRNGSHLHDRTNRIRISVSRRGTSSKLRIKRIREEDGGLFGCQAFNVISHSNQQTIDVSVIPDVEPTKLHSVICSEHSYCLNGGTCFILLSLYHRYCVCQEGFRGQRCQEREVSITAFPISTLIERGIRPFETILIICGVVATAVVIVAIAIVIFASARRHIIEKEEVKRHKHLTDSQRLLSNNVYSTNSDMRETTMTQYQQKLPQQPTSIDTNDNNVILRHHSRRSNGRIVHTNKTASGRSRLQATSATLDSYELDNEGQLAVSDTEVEDTIQPSSDVQAAASLSVDADNNATSILVEKETTC